MSIVRAKTMDLKDIGNLTDKQKQNSRLNKEEALTNRCILKSVPQRVVLEMTSACNIRCKMCGRSAVNFKPTFFKKEWLKLLEPISDRIEEVTLLGWGEPTLHPDFTYFLKWAHERKLRKFFCTNGTKLKILKEDIFRYEVELLTVSLDGATAGTNNQIRYGEDFEEITSAIREIVEEKKKKGTPYPYISIVMTLMESNYREFPDFVRLAKDLEIQEAKGVYLTVFDEKLLEEGLYDKKILLKEVFDKAEKIGDELGITVKLPYLQGEDIAGDKCHKDCFVGWRDLFLGSDGFVRPCMSTSQKLFHINKYSSFSEIWNSEEYQVFRSGINNEKMPKACCNCYQASFANWNRKNAFIQIGNDFAPEWENNNF